MSDLRNRIIRLAYENPELRGDLLPLVKEARAAKFPKLPKEVADLIRDEIKGLKRALRGTPNFGDVSWALTEIQMRLEDDFRSDPDTFRRMSKYNTAIADWAKSEYERKSGESWW